MDRRHENARRPRRRVRPAAIAALIFLVHSSGFGGEDLGTAIEKLGRRLEAVRNQRGEALHLSKDARVASFLAALGELQKIDQRLGLLKASFSFGYTGDRSYSGSEPRDSNHLLNVDTNIVKDHYPSALKFKTSMKLLMSKGSLQSESSTIVLGFNYYLRPFLEAYAFTEKFSDSFMSVKQRYETGAGFKFEFTADPVRNAPEMDAVRTLQEMTGGAGPGAAPALHRTADKAEKRFMENVRDLEQRFLEVLKETQVSDEDLTAVFGFLETVETYLGRIDAALVKARSWLTAGIAFTAFSEVEQDEIPTYTLSASGQKVTKSYLLDPEQRFRFIIRPTIECDIAEGVTFSSMVYFKLPLGGPYTKLIIMDPENPAQKTRKYDWRLDAAADLKISLARNTAWGGDVSLILEYQYHYDNAPPSLPEALSGVTFQGLNVKNNLAANAHAFYMLKINIGF